MLRRRRNALHSQGSRAISRLALQRALSLPRMGLQPAANAHLQSPAVLLLRPAVRPLSPAVLLLSPAVRPLSTAVRPLSTAVAEMSTTGEGESSEAPALPTIIELPTVAAVLAAHLEHGERYGPADHALSWSRISHLVSALDAIMGKDWAIAPFIHSGFGGSGNNDQTWCVHAESPMAACSLG